MNQSNVATDFLLRLNSIKMLLKNENIELKKKEEEKSEIQLLG